MMTRQAFGVFGATGREMTNTRRFRRSLG